METNYGFPATKLVIPIVEVIVTLAAQQVLNVSTLGAPTKDKGKGLQVKKISPMKTLEQIVRWSHEKINQVIQETLFLQSMKLNMNPLKGISSYFSKGILYDFHYVLLVSYALLMS